MTLGETKKISVCLVTVHSLVQFLAVVARLVLAVMTLGGASDSGAGIRDDVVSGAIGAGVCDGVACGICGIRAGVCDKVACVVLAVLASWAIPPVLVVWEVVGVIW
jgi:hypothetical protein